VSSSLLNRTWRLRYNFPSGVQHGRMPSPGARYSGTSREAFLPNTEQGREGVELLKRAFRGGHLMMVGTSVTTGQTNTVIWGGIHQKTGPHGGAANHGCDCTHQHDCTHAHMHMLTFIAELNARHRHIFGVSLSFLLLNKLLLFFFFFVF
jgi:hypothetical protein